MSRDAKIIISVLGSLIVLLIGLVIYGINKTDKLDTKIDTVNSNLTNRIDGLYGFMLNKRSGNKINLSKKEHSKK